MMTHPLAVCLGSFGSFFLVDYTDGCLFKARLHNPVELELLVDELAQPTGVTYMKSVVYVAEKSAVTYVDVGGVVKLKPSRMEKHQLVEELSKRGLLENGAKIDSSNEGASLLWMNENLRRTGKARNSEILIDGLSPLALVSDEKIEGLFVSQRNSSVTLKQAVKSNGLALEAKQRTFKCPWECLCDRPAHKQPNGRPLCCRF